MVRPPGLNLPDVNKYYIMMVQIWMLSPRDTHTKIISNNDDDKITKRIREDLNKKRSWFSLYVFS